MARFVVETDDGVVFTRLEHVVDVDVVPKDLDCVGVGFVDRGAGKADKGGVGQCLAQIRAKTFEQVVLGAVRFVGHDQDIAAR